MSENMANPKDFLAEAVAVLQSIEAELTALAQAALLVQPQGSTAESENGHDRGRLEPARHLQYISQQLSKLSEHSKFLQSTLQNEVDTELLVDHDWPQIRVLQSQEEERMQLARELEDGVGQLLANAIFELASVRHILAGGGEPVAAGLDALQEELEQGLADIRHLIIDLEPSAILSTFGLSGGIRRYLEQYQSRTGLQTELRMQANIGRLPSIIETAIFRVVQEALSNVYRHAKASRVEVVVEEKEATLQFSIIDDGAGFNSEKIGLKKSNLGLARMVDYAELLKGDLRILSEPGVGSQVILSLSYPTL
jgi:two-component system sensor histidine kinase DegS